MQDLWPYPDREKSVQQQRDFLEPGSFRGVIRKEREFQPKERGKRPDNQAEMNDDCKKHPQYPSMMVSNQPMHER
jgi:hypothetical protein